MATELEKAEILVELGYHHRKGKELARRAREAGIGRGTLMQVLQRDSGQLDRLLERED
jgi:lambda repressor-like predicted transcriptional regulator